MNEKKRGTMNANRSGRLAFVSLCLLTLAGFAWAQDEPSAGAGKEKSRREEKQEKKRLEKADKGTKEKDKGTKEKEREGKKKEKSENPEFLPGNLLRRADGNGDGIVTPEEFNAAMRKVFDGADRDQNGALDKKELAQLLRLFNPPPPGPDGQGMMGEGRPPMGAEGPHPPEVFWERYLKRFDADQDDRITAAEWQGPPERFKVLDANGDGAVTKTEAEEAARRLQRTMREQGALPGEGAEGQPPNLERRAESFLKRFDKDGDGKVAADEFEGREEMFKALDADRDGFVTADEIKASPPRRRLEGPAGEPPRKGAPGAPLGEGSRDAGPPPAKF